MKVGRNDPCPCGSGKKFKKCCLGKEGAAPARPPGDLGAALPPAPSKRHPAAPRPPARPAAPPKPPPRPRSPAEERWDARWKEFESQDDAGRVALFLQTLDDKELMTDEMAFEMLSRLHQDALQRGERARFAELVAALRERQPEVYQESAHFYISWSLQDALAESRPDDDLLPLALDLAAHAGRDIDIVNRSLDALAYHGKLAVLVEAMRVAWPEVKESDNVVPWGVTEFAEKGADYEIYNYLEHAASPDPADAALLGRVKFFAEDLRPEYLPQRIGDLTGQATPAWAVEDFALKPPQKDTRDDWDEDEEEEEEPPDPGALNLSRLIAQFVGYLRREEGVPFPRGELVSDELYRYFVRRHEGDLDPRPSMLERAMNPKMKLPPPPKPGHPLCPERVTLEVCLAGLIGFFTPQHHLAAALFEVMPAWLRFLESRRLIDPDRRVKTVEELGPLRDSVLRMWEKYAEDPALYRAALAWPEDAAKGPSELGRRPREAGAAGVE
jgi:hypothetical protein